MKGEFPFVVTVPKRYKIKKRKRLRYEAILTEAFYKAMKRDKQLLTEMLRDVDAVFFE